MVKEYDYIKIDEDKCIACCACEGVCPNDAINTEEGFATIVEGACIGCGACVGACPVEALDLV